jgi:hypothetical protein
MSERRLVNSGIYVRVLTDNNFLVKMGEHWVAIQYFPRARVYIVRGEVSDGGCEPIVKQNDILWINTAIRGIEDERKSYDYAIVYAQKS